MVFIKFLFSNKFCLYWLFLNCIILFQTGFSEIVDATTSSLNVDDSIDQSTSTVRNQETVIANSTGNLLNSNDQTTYYVSSPNELIDNETNSNPIVISNNVSVNKHQQVKPNSTQINHIMDAMMSEGLSTDQTDRNRQSDSSYLNNAMNNENMMYNYASTSAGSDHNPSTSTLSSVTTKSNKNQYEFLSVPITATNNNQLTSFNQVQNQLQNQQLQNQKIQNQQIANLVSSKLNNQINQMDDLIEFKLNGSSTNKYYDKTMNSLSTSAPNLSTPTLNNNQITQTPSTTNSERSAGTPVLVSSESPIMNIDSMPELYAPLSSFANTLQQVNQQSKHKSVIDKHLNTIPKNMPINQATLLSNQSSTEQNQPSINSENRLRWINNYNTRNKSPFYPPKVPAQPGIPSGLRNPSSNSQSNTLPPSNNNVLPSGFINGVSTPPLNSAANSPPYLSNIINNSGASSNNPNINLASIVNSLSSPNNLHQPGFGGSSLNPTGFPYPTANNLIGPPSIFSNGAMINPNLSPEIEAEIEAGLATATHSFSRRPGVNITRVEHIAAECSDDYMKVVINFNGTFTGLVYSSGYVHDQNCIYVNGTGRNGYEFYIRLNQCGTMGREEMHHPKRPGEVRRRDQVMWNTLSIQYNSLIEEEWDEHYRVTCEYGSDYWKTVTFPAFNVEVNTGSPVVFTINPPQCQMEIRRGFGIAGSRTTGPVTVGDPLTLLIHMKSEKAGFDILVKNCISHNGGTQRLQLIDTNGCVTNEKLISPFRGTYNSDDGHQVTLYSYLKAFRFTGSPALYLECDIHMCHNKCPPQRCYWRNLSKRSISNESYYEQEGEQYGEPFSIGRYNFTLPKTNEQTENNTGVISESLSLFQALEVRHSDDTEEDYYEPNSMNNKYEFIHSKLAKKRSRKGDALKYLDEYDEFSSDLPPEHKFCFTGLNLTFVTVSTITVLISAISLSVLSCLRLRKFKIDYLRYDDRLSAISKSSKSTCSNTAAMFYNQPHFSRRY